jgi:Group 4 capsule polysaccharide lipoprotein gfcB, YjbF
MVEVLAMRNVFQAAGLCLLILTACGSTEPGTQPPTLVMISLLTEQVRARTAPTAAVPVNAAVILTRKNLAEIGVPLIRITAPKSGTVSLLYISQRHSGAQIWKTPDNLSFTLRDGIVTQTRGLVEDLYATDVSRLQAALSGTGSTTGITRVIQRIDGANALIPFQYSCDVTRMGAEAIVIIGQTYSTQHYRETCAGKDGGFANDYWIDSRGILRLSQQWIGAEFGYVRLERLID